MIIAEVWKTAPFIGLLVLAGMQMIPLDIYEAARLDGAGWWRQFRSITLPLVKPTLLVAILFRLLDATINTGMELTESYAMLPTAAVAGFYLAHPEAHYFAVSKIAEDQVQDWADRAGMPVAEAKRWLAPLL